MNKIDLLYGFLIGLLAAILGAYLFIVLFTPYDFIDGVGTLRSKGQLGKLITIGAILDLLAFFVLLKYKKELMARGVVLATIIITIITLFV